MKEHSFGLGVRGRQERRQNSPLLFLLLFFLPENLPVVKVSEKSNTLCFGQIKKNFERLIITENSNILAMPAHLFLFWAYMLSYR